MDKTLEEQITILKKLPIMSEYHKWVREHSEDYTYDEIHSFIEKYTRGELCALFDHVDALLSPKEER